MMSAIAPYEPARVIFSSSKLTIFTELELNEGMRPSTVAEVIDALGGNRAVADLTGVGLTAVCNWRAWGRFPQRLHYQIFRECERRGIKLPVNFFEREVA